MYQKCVVQTYKKHDNFFEMDKKSENTYQYKDKYIYSNQIDLYYYEPAKNTNFPLFEFTGVKDPNNKKEVSFPKYWGSLKAKLISPLTGKLKKGTKYNFNVYMCDMDELYLIIGKKRNKLKKEENNFTGEYLIDNNKVSIAYQDNSEESTIFEFEVVK